MGWTKYAADGTEQVTGGGTGGGGAPTGTAGGDLGGTYPNPQVTSGANHTHTAAQIPRLDLITAPSNSLSLNAQRITSLADPTAASDAVTKSYADSISGGLDPHDSVKVATTANITLSGTQTIDGVGVVAGDRVLVKDQTTQSQNGIYVVASGAWSRATDADTGAELSGGSFVFVEQGIANADKGFVNTFNGTPTLGTDAITWSQFTGGGSSGSTIDASQIVSGTVATARLGSGTPSAYTVLRGDQSWGTDFPLTVGAAKTASYTLALGDQGTLITMSPATSGTTLTVTVPSNATAAFVVGSEIIIRQGTTGTVVVAAGSGATIASRDNVLTLSGQYAYATLVKTGTNAWELTGDLLSTGGGGGGYTPGGTDVALADGGTGASLADPNADRIMFWDDSAGATTWLTPGTNLSITGTTLDATAGAGGAPTDATYITQTPNASLSNEQALNALSNGILKHSAGVVAAAVSGTDYSAPGHAHATTDITSGTMATARLGSGAASSTTFLRGDQTWATPAGGGGGGAPAYTVRVAASDAGTASQAAADFVCDGTNDEVELQAAWAALPASGGRLLLSEGTFNLLKPFYATNLGRVTIEGMNHVGTVLKAATGFASTGTDRAVMFVQKPGTYGSNVARGVGVPSQPDPVQGAAGNVNAGTHTYKVNWVTAAGEIHGRIVNITLSVASQVSLTNIPVAPAAWNVTARKIYRNDAATSGVMKLVTTINDNTTTTFTDNLADASLGAVDPDLAPQDSVNIKNLWLNGNGLGTGDGSGISGLVIQAYNSNVENCMVSGNGRFGIELRGITAAERSNAGGLNQWTCYRTQIRDCKIFSNAIAGMKFSPGSTDAGFGPNNHVFQNAGRGVDVGSTAVSGIIGNYIWGNDDDAIGTQGAGIYITSGSARVPIIGNKIEQNRGGIYATSGASISIISNIFASNSSTLAQGPSQWRAAAGRATNQHDSINLSNPWSTIISDNVFDENAYANDRTRYCINSGSGNNILITNNSLLGAMTAPVFFSSFPNTSYIGNNIGWVTESSGSATVTSAATSVVVTHGLSYTPSINIINVIPTNSLGSSAKFWVSTVTSTTFTINVNVAPGATTATFAWNISTGRKS